jgi:outer membrane receptor for ferrienterochelin and colicin
MALLNSVIPVAAAQKDEPVLENIVVTGSFIRNSKFAQNNPVETVTQADLLESGQPNIATYIRDLPFTQNTNVVANVNAGNSGTQSSVGTTFNLRGLGENSTLTLMDGTRSVDAGINTLLPDIAVDRLEVVLDGGSALYGSDAVAGVVNLVPIKKFDGFRTRLYYQEDGESTFDDRKISALFGKTFGNGLNWVVAADYAETSPLMNFERPRTLRSDYGWATSGNPGVWRELQGASPNVGGVHGGELVGNNLVDPSCGTFNEVTDLGARLNNPSGIPQPGGNCFFTYSAQWPLVEGRTEWNIFSNLTWTLSDSVELDAQVANASRSSDNHNTLTYQLNANNRFALLVPADHPNNPFGFDVGPQLWRPFAAAGTRPSYTDPYTGARKQRFTDEIERYKVGARFELGGEWSGNAYYSYQSFEQQDEQKMINLPRLQAALLGQGGPGGNEYLNPFGSADARSPFFVAGETENSQELIDWLAPEVNFTDLERTLDIFELNLTGPLFELPAGTLYMATGYQYRNIEETDFANPLSASGEDYNTSIIDSPPRDLSYGSAVQAAYVELEVPILSTLDAQIAVRYEDFTDFNIDTTTPKVALRWEATPELAIRTSVGESFLAPTPADARPFDPNENCGEIFFGGDPLTGGVLNGGASCSSGNPGLDPETSRIWNIGFTWEPTANLSLSMDYQSIEYEDRIRTLGTLDVVNIEFNSMLAAIGETAATYDPTPGSASRTAANAWLASVGDPSVTRDPDTQQVSRVVRQAANISNVYVDLIDGRANYRWDSRRLGSFDATLSATYYTTYEYNAFDGDRVDAAGKQNARTGIVPPIPELKMQFRLDWSRDRHSATALVNWQDSVTFDDQVNNVLTGTPAPADGKIDDMAYVNLNYQYLFTSVLGGDIALRAGINNLFDEQPQLLPILGGFESRLHTPWGRQFFVSADFQFGN